ncbi:response regulator [Patescibacteria group bacterium]|nr:response regulator [Patescibacteria group bacterium]MBU1613311.1 response regulator [Patescibacteria group bacterium]
MPAEITKKRILHVDDEPDTLKVVKTILEKEGYEVVSVQDGKKALQQVELDNFSLLLLDIMMPDMSGWDLFTRISQIKSTYNVVFLTVLEIPEERLNELKEAGIRDYIVKPFERDDLVKRVKAVLGD